MDDVTNPVEPEVISHEQAEDFPDNVEAVETEDGEFDGEDNSADTQEPSPQNDGDEWQEIEWKGQKIRVPKDTVMMQSDYTRKTQEVAAKRKELEATLERVTHTSQAESQALGNYALIAGQLAQYDNVDWEAWQADDPASALRARQEVIELKMRGAAAEQAYHAAREQTLSVSQQVTAKRLEEARQFASENIRDWNDDKERAIVDFGTKAYNLAVDDIREAVINNPAVLLVLNDALELREMKAKAKQQAKVAAVKAVQPVPTLKGNNARTGPRPDTENFRDFDKYAAKVLAGR